MHIMPCTLAKIRLPSLFGDDTCIVLKPRGPIWENNGQMRPHFPLLLPSGKQGFLSRSDFIEALLGKSALASFGWEGSAPGALWEGNSVPGGS